jgi:negative regulator of sigma E activity
MSDHRVRVDGAEPLKEECKVVSARLAMGSLYALVGVSFIVCTVVAFGVVPYLHQQRLQAENDIAVMEKLRLAYEAAAHVQHYPSNAASTDPLGRLVTKNINLAQEMCRSGQESWANRLLEETADVARDRVPVLEVTANCDVRAKHTEDRRAPR